jgi:hypothetical protein
LRLRSRRLLRSLGGSSAKRVQVTKIEGNCLKEILCLGLF